MADYKLVQDALSRGYSLDEIADKISSDEGIDPSVARERGYSSQEILGTLGYAQEQKPEESAFGALKRGATEAFQQLPQLARGVQAGIGAAAESAFGEGGIATSIKKSGIEGYKAWGDKIAKNSQEADSIDYSWDKAKEGDFGSLVNWLAHGLGYVGGQAVQTLATGGIGAVGGKFVAGTAAKQIAEGMVAKEAARLTAENAGLATGEQLAADAIAKAATQNVAAKFAAIGSTAALGVNATGMEGGEIFGDLTSKDPNKVLTGNELGKAFASTLAAGGLEFVGDKLGLDIMLGKSSLLKPAQFAQGMGGRAARGLMAGAAAVPVEAGTEYLQTGLEEYGKGNEANILPFNQSEGAQKQARESAALGGLGGAFVGGVGGAIHGAKERPDPVVPPANILSAGTTDEAITEFIGETSRQIVPSNFTAEPRGLMGSSTAATAGPSFDARSVAGDYMDQRELDDLVQTERRNQQAMIGQLDQQRQKQAELDQIPKIAAEQNATQAAVQRAATVEAPTAMQLALERARGGQAPAQNSAPSAGQAQVNVAPAALQSEATAAPAPRQSEPRIVERTDSMVPIPRELAELQVEMAGGEVVRIPNRNGKFAYTVIPKAADDSRNAPVQSIPSSSTGRGSAEPGIGLEVALGRGGAQGQRLEPGLPGAASPGESVAPTGGPNANAVALARPADAAVKSGDATPQTQAPPATADQMEPTGSVVGANGLRSVSTPERQSEQRPGVHGLDGGNGERSAADSGRPTGQMGVESNNRPTGSGQGQESGNAPTDGQRQLRTPAFDFTRNDTGTVLVHGDPAAIRAAGINGLVKFDAGKPTGILVSVKNAPDVIAQLEASRVQNNPENPANIEAAPAQARAEAPAVEGSAPGQAAEPAAGSGAVQAVTQPQGTPNDQAPKALEAKPSAPAQAATDQRLIPVSQREPKPIDPRLLSKTTRAIDPEHLGADNTPLFQGGKPFKTRAAAAEARKNQPMMRVIKSGKGFALAPKSEKQLAAEAKAAKRLANPQTSPRGEPIPAHAFIAAEGGLHADIKPEMSIDGNPRIGNRTLFAGDGKGLSMERSTERLIEEGYLPEGASHNDATELIKRSLTQPKYTATGTETAAQAEIDTRFADHLAAQEEAAQNEDFDPFESLAEDGFDPFDIDHTGYSELADPIKQEVNALLALAESKGIDVDTIKEQAHEDTREGSEQDFYEAAKSALTAAIEEGNRSSVEDSGQAGDAGSEGLIAPTREDVLAQQAQREAEQKRKDEGGDKLIQAKSFTADQVDLFNPQASIFDAPAEPAQPTTEAKDADPIATAVQAMADAVKGLQTALAPKVDQAAKIQSEPAGILNSETYLWSRITDGTATVDEFKAGFERWVSSKDEIVSSLMKNTKDQLLKMRGLLYDRYKNEPKAELVDAMWRDGLQRYVLGRSFSYGMGKNAMENGVRNMVESTDAEQLAQYAKDRKSAQEEAVARVAKVAEAIKDPQTLTDFQTWMRATMNTGKTFKEARLELTPAQRAQYDELAATASRAERSTRKEAQQDAILRAPGEAVTATEIIKTKHTKHGHDLWQFNLEQRVSGDEFKSLVAQAKRLGGDYSSYRGNGAIPGWQFRTEDAAKAFKALIAGDTTAAKDVMQERRDSFADDRSQSATERLNEMADRLDERADASLNQERKANTDKRARQAASAEAAANAEKAMAKTMRNIAQAITAGKAKFLDRVRQKVQVEALQGYVATAKGDELRAKYASYAEQEKHRGEAPTAETADFAEFPTFTAYRSDLATLARQLLDVDGTKLLGQRLLKEADDVSDAYTKFAKENFGKVSAFSSRGGVAAFGTKADAEAAIARSGYKGKAIAYQVKRGEHAVILSPSEAVERGIWKGDGDKRLTLAPDIGAELVEKIGKAARRGAKVSVPWQLETAHDRRKVLARMGIETPAEFRAALREFIGLREQAEAPSKVKQLERAMVGRRNDGLDFFPTPESVADEMVETAGIEPGMAVLEPSAGWGHIAERIRAAGVDPDVGEMSEDRRELLEAKGFRMVGRDFMEMSPRSFMFGDTFKAADGTEGVMRGSGALGSNRVRLVDSEGNQSFQDRDELTGIKKNGTESGYDRILMNPPFSDGRDIQHVQHAYTLLKPGGRIVAIMGESAFTNQNKRATEFRTWLEQVGGTEEKLAEGSFNDPSLPVNTGANARMVVIEKGEPSDGTKFSKGEQAAGITKSQFTTELEKAFGPKVASRLISDGIMIPVEKQAQLPAHILKLATDGDVIFGVHDMKANGTYAVLENLEPGSVKGIVLHEVGVHYGFEGMLGKDKYAQVLKRLDMMRRAGNAIVKESHRVASKNAVSVSQIPEEHITYLVQMHPELGVVKEIIAKIKAFLFNEFGIGGKYLTDDDIVMLATAAVKYSTRNQGGGMMTAFSHGGRSADPVRAGDVYRAPTGEAVTVMRALPGGNVEVRIQGKKMRLGDFKNNELKAWPKIGRADYADGAYTTPQSLIDLAKNEPTAPDSGIKFSRSVITGQSLSNITQTLKEATAPIGTVSLWDKTVGTKYHLATKDADFKRVFDGYTQQTDDTAHYAIEAERHAPDILMRLESLGDIWSGLMHSGAKHKANVEAVSKALFANIEGKKGIQQFVFDDLTLKQVYKLTPKQIEMYRQARKAVDTSIERLAQTFAAQMGADQGMDIASVKNFSLDDTVEMVKTHVQDAHDEARAAYDNARQLMSEITPEDEMADETAAEMKKSFSKVPKGPTEEETAEVLQRLTDMQKHAEFLQESGYMPALRFGEFAVTVTKDGETLHFEMFESKTAANLAAMKLKKEYPDAQIAKSVLNPQQYAMFKGVSPETVELFARFTGMDQNEAYQDYIALAKSARSVKVRELKRKGTAGFSEDATRVMASFITSNARQSAVNMNSNEIAEAMASKSLAKKGDVQREAQKLHEYMANPLEEARRIRGFMFMHFMGGSVASAMVNLTQPVLQTTPYLHQFAGAKVAGIMLRSAKMAATGKIDGKELGDAVKRAAEDGITEPHEIHQLMADASNTSLGSSLKARAAIKAWGSFFSLTEAYNRRLTFIAAYQTARETGVKDAYEFARKAVIETQGLYAKQNRPNWARGAVGATLFTFKQFGIAYVEFLARLPTKQKALALSLLVLAAGLQGLPGADDLEDLIDTIGQSMGYNTNSKKALRKQLLAAFGEDLGEILDSGIFTKSAVDVQGRLGMGNLLPATAIFKPSETDKSRTMSELAGPLGGLLTAFQNAVGKVQRGDYSGSIKELAPVAIKNLMKGIDMAASGVYKDAKGRKVADVDALDSFVKMLGLQPSSIAKSTRILSDELQDKGMVNTVEAMIADKWAQGVHEKDYRQVMEARRTLIAWNENNPLTPIKITPAQIQSRVKQMNMTRVQRYLKTTPKELRANSAKELS